MTNTCYYSVRIPASGRWGGNACHSVMRTWVWIASTHRNGHLWLQYACVTPALSRQRQEDSLGLLASQTRQTGELLLVQWEILSPRKVERGWGRLNIDTCAHRCTTHTCQCIPHTQTCTHMQNILAFLQCSSCFFFLIWFTLNGYCCYFSCIKENKWQRI